MRVLIKLMTFFLIEIIRGQVRRNEKNILSNTSKTKHIVYIMHYHHYSSIYYKHISVCNIDKLNKSEAK